MPQEQQHQKPTTDPRDAEIAELKAKLEGFQSLEARLAALEQKPAAVVAGVGGTPYQMPDNPEQIYAERRAKQREAAKAPHPDKHGELVEKQELHDGTIVDPRHCVQDPVNKDRRAMRIVYRPSPEGSTIIGGPYDGKRL